VGVGAPVPPDQGVVIGSEIIENLLTHWRMSLYSHERWHKPSNRKARKRLRLG
jgi:hypothetical protein